MYRLRRRRGVSTFIATLLMMVLAVSAGVVIYAYTMGYLGGLGESETPGKLSLDAAVGTTSQIKAWIRNIGTSNVTMDRVYVNKEPHNLGSGNTTTPIAQGSVGLIVITPPTGSYTSGNTYEVKLVAKDNTQLVFSVKIQ